MKKLSKEEFETVITSGILLGKSANQAAKDAGIGSSTASGIIRAFELMRSGNLERLREEAGKNIKISRTIVGLAAEKLGMEVPADVIQEINARMVWEREYKKELKARRKHGLEPEAEEEEPKQEAKPEPPPVNDTLYFIRILEELHLQNEYLKDLLDVVLPKYVQDLKDNLNANSDVLGADLRGCLEELKAIRCNTRKRGL